jgi:hypothetical protein
MARDRMMVWGRIQKTRQSMRQRRGRRRRQSRRGQTMRLQRGGAGGWGSY